MPLKAIETIAPDGCKAARNIVLGRPRITDARAATLVSSSFGAQGTGVEHQRGH